MGHSTWLRSGIGRTNSLPGKKFDDSGRIEAGLRCWAKWRMMRALFMFAALLFSGGAWASTPADSSPGTTAVLFEFQRPVSEAYWEELKGQLEQNATPVWPEREMRWMKREEFRSGMEFPEVVQVRLQGHCKAELTTSWRYSEGALGWVYKIGDEVQPIVYVNCDRIGQTLERELRGANSTERKQKFVRAISRVVAHELTHIFTQSAKHSPSGLQRAWLTPVELTKADFPAAQEQKQILRTQKSAGVGMTGWTE